VLNKIVRVPKAIDIEGIDAQDTLGLIGFCGK
jgi:hypothetical protein